MSKLTAVLWGTWSWKRPFYTIAFIYLALGIVAVFFADKLLFFPPSEHYNEDLKNFHPIENEEQIVASVYFPAQKGKPTILWSHGNAEDIGQLTDVFEALNKLGYGILAYDYPGYGLTSGKPTESTCYKAADTAYNHLIKNLNIAKKNIIILGQSVGTGPSTYLAENYQPTAIILISPFTSVYRAGIKYPIYPRDRFPNIKRIKNIKSPILFIHGETDEVIPHKHSEQLIAKHPGENQLLTVPRTGHNDIYFREFKMVITTIDQFISTHR